MKRKKFGCAIFDCLEDAFLYSKRQKEEYGNNIQIEIEESLVDEPMRWWNVTIWRIYD